MANSSNKIACRCSLKAQACHQFYAGVALAVSFCALVQEMRLQGPFQGQRNLQMEGLFGSASVSQTLRCKLLRTDAEKQMGSIIDQRQFASLPMLKTPV